LDGARGLRRRAHIPEVTDAWIASATESSSEHLVTFDRDFLKLLPRSDFTLLTVETEND
jgi:predicted nucleic acid-binding protein